MKERKNLTTKSFTAHEKKLCWCACVSTFYLLHCIKYDWNGSEQKAAKKERFLQEKMRGGDRELSSKTWNGRKVTT